MQGDSIGDIKVIYTIVKVMIISGHEVTRHFPLFTRRKCSNFVIFLERFGHQRERNRWFSGLPQFVCHLGLAV
jgi:hypothetical protein